MPVPFFPLYISSQIVFIKWLLSFEVLFKWVLWKRPQNIIAVFSDEKKRPHVNYETLKKCAIQNYWQYVKCLFLKSDGHQMETLQRTVNIFMKAMHKSVIFFPLLWMRWPTHDIHSLQVLVWVHQRVLGSALLKNLSSSNDGRCSLSPGQLSQ